MATKAAKSITINATKYELANALGVDNGKIQLKAKDVVLDEVTPPAADSYVRFVYDHANQTIEVEKSADITNMTWAQFAEKVRTGTKVSMKLIINHNSYLNYDNAYIVEDPTIIDGIVNFDETCVKFQFTGVNLADGTWTGLTYNGAKPFYYSYYWRAPRASTIDWANFADLPHIDERVIADLT
jgi:hypothetical protein